jgi:hypothetical protein
MARHLSPLCSWKGRASAAQAEVRAHDQPMVGEKIAQGRRRHSKREGCASQHRHPLSAVRAAARIRAIERGERGDAARWVACEGGRDEGRDGKETRAGGDGGFAQGGWCEDGGGGHDGTRGGGRDNMAGARRGRRAAREGARHGVPRDGTGTAGSRGQAAQRCLRLTRGRDEVLRAGRG